MSAGVAPGRLYLVDTSAFARIDQLPVRDVVAALVADQAVATCVTVDLEACYSGRNEDDVRSIERHRRSQYRALPINEAIAQRARDVQVRMSGRGHHRAAGVVDLLTAAIAEYHGAIVLHYDAGFEHIAATTGQPHVWVVPRGTLS